MDVDVALLEERRVDAEGCRAGLHDGEGRLHALAHDVAELAREDQLAAARCARRLDEQDVAADGRPGEAGRHARHAGAHRHPALEPPRPQDGPEIVAGDRDLLALTPGPTHGTESVGARVFQYVYISVV